MIYRTYHSSSSDKGRMTDWCNLLTSFLLSSLKKKTAASILICGEVAVSMQVHASDSSKKNTNIGPYSSILVQAFLDDLARGHIRIMAICCHENK
jgi:hypothetical protein